MSDRPPQATTNHLQSIAATVPQINAVKEYIPAILITFHTAAATLIEGATAQPSNDCTRETKFVLLTLVFILSVIIGWLTSDWYCAGNWRCIVGNILNLFVIPSYLLFLRSDVIVCWYDHNDPLSIDSGEFELVILTTLVVSLAFLIVGPAWFQTLHDRPKFQIIPHPTPDGTSRKGQATELLPTANDQQADNKIDLKQSFESKNAASGLTPLQQLLAESDDEEGISYSHSRRRYPTAVGLGTTAL
eukprot:TRINITY_DN3615_c0_g1_i1.p1 TRINITY_DN3615_c0_g1~~TRINITY_DN3615_c0_g1_i1.p1  ORF type:complete len:246 (+),score=30.18 TRINITY_DN3615_c0_g1_i1:100-837(+)